MNNYSYVLLYTLPYEGCWIKGVVQSLDEALDYYKNKVTNDYFDYWVEVYYKKN
jgi:hypothetical protein